MYLTPNSYSDISFIYVFTFILFFFPNLQEGGRPVALMYEPRLVEAKTKFS